MKLFNNASREHLVEIIEYFIDQTFEKYEGSISDVISEFYAANFTRNEILNILNKRYLDSYEWAEEEEANEKINTETGEGVFWKEYTEEEETKDESKELKATVLPIYFDFIEMLENAKVNFTKYSAEKTIEIRDGYDTVDFIFDRETLRLKEVSF